MSATPSGSGGALPGRSEIEDWPTQHLDNAATQLRSLGSQSVALFDQHRQNVAAPGGTTWEGDAKDAALDRVTADTAVVRRQSAVQDEAADLAENGGHDVRSAKRAALEAITDAEDDGFSVGEDLSVTDTRETDRDTLAARQTAAAEHAEYIRFNAEQLVQADSLVGQRLQSKAVELEGIRFEGEGDGRETEGTVQLVDNTIKLNPPDESAEDGKGPPDGKPGADPERKPPDGVEGTLEDLLTPDEAPPGEPGDGEPTGFPPALSQRPPSSALDQILNQHTGTGKKGGQDPRYTRSPLTAPIVAADPSVLDRQAARVDAARQSLDAAQAEMNNAAGQGYTQGAGAGPGRDVTDPLSQAVFDARRELTTQTEILEDLNQAAAETGAGTVPIPALPENADVQAFPPPPSIASQAAEGLSEASHDVSESTFGLVPDVAHDIEVFSNWGEHSGADQIGAVLDAAGSVPIPGAKPLAEGIEHGLEALTGASRHVDDVPTPHSDVPSAGQVDPPTGDPPHLTSADTGYVAPYGFEDTAALLTNSESAGGHLIERHVAQTPDDLAARLDAGPRPGAVSTFASTDEATTAVSTALQHNQAAIDAWVANGATDRLKISVPFDGGEVLFRGAAETVPGTSVLVILEGVGNGQWIVLTGYPKP